MRCPNTAADGCRCWEHHPGLGYTDHDDHVVFNVVTFLAERARSDAGEDLTRRARQTCDACQDNPSVCQAGTGPPRFQRVPGCAAWTDNGEPALLHAAPQPRQPWEPRPARHAA